MEWRQKKQSRFCDQLTYVATLFQLNYIWRVSRNPRIECNVSSEKEVKKGLTKTVRQYKMKQNYASIKAITERIAKHNYEADYT